LRGAAPLIAASIITFAIPPSARAYQRTTCSYTFGSCRGKDVMSSITR